jgi:alpha-amylase
LGFQRRLGNERTLVLINYGSKPRTVQPAGLGGARLVALHGGGGSPLTLPPQSVRVFDLR